MQTFYPLSLKTREITTVLLYSITCQSERDVIHQLFKDDKIITKPYRHNPFLLHRPGTKDVDLLS